MSEFFSSWSGNNFIGLVAVLCGSLIAITAIVAAQWRSLRQSEIETALKQEMLTRGMSAEDIERVIKARAKKC